MTPMRPGRAAENLGASLMCASRDPRLAVFATAGDRPAPDHEQLDALCRDVVSDVPCFEWYMDGDGLRDRVLVQARLTGLMC